MRNTLIEEISVFFYLTLPQKDSDQLRTKVGNIEHLLHILPIKFSLIASLALSKKKSFLLKNVDFLLVSHK